MTAGSSSFRCAEFWGVSSARSPRVLAAVLQKFTERERESERERTNILFLLHTLDRECAYCTADSDKALANNSQMGHELRQLLYIYIYIYTYMYREREILQSCPVIILFYDIADNHPLQIG